jgi:4-hydroxy-3-methylbut-2-enyl diphosphate reductase
MASMKNNTKDKTNVTVQRARQAGYCYGVERAIKKVEKALSSHETVYSLGPIIHNPQVVEELKAKGLVLAKDVDEVPEGATVIIRSHGVAPQVLEQLKERKAIVIDATCPFVRRAQVVASRLHDRGYSVVVVGEPTHPEVLGILGYAGPDATVVSSRAEAEKLPPARRRGVVFQTTQSDAIIEDVAAALVRSSEEVVFHNTICEATTERQEAARELAASSDVVFVVGGRNSGNTRRLYEICSAINARTFLIETADEIDASHVAGARVIGVTAGASTPRTIIDEVVRRIEERVGGGER